MRNSTFQELTELASDLDLDLDSDLLDLLDLLNVLDFDI